MRVHEHPRSGREIGPRGMLRNGCWRVPVACRRPARKPPWRGACRHRSPMHSKLNWAALISPNGLPTHGWTTSRQLGNVTTIGDNGGTSGCGSGAAGCSGSCGSGSDGGGGGSGGGAGVDIA